MNIRIIGPVSVQMRANSQVKFQFNVTNATNTDIYSTSVQTILYVRGVSQRRYNHLYFLYLLTLKKMAKMTMIEEAALEGMIFAGSVSE